MSFHNSLLHRLYNLFLEPKTKTESEREYSQSILLSVFQLSIIPLAILTIITADLVYVDPGPLVLMAVAGILLVYSISRRIAYRISSRIIVILYTFLPILIWFSVTAWQVYDIPRILPFIIVAISIGALFTDTQIVLIQVSSLSIIVVYVAGVVHGVPLLEYDSYLLTIISAALIVIVFSRTLNSYLDEINRQRYDLEQQNKDLDIYTRILRHDLSNDLQAVINSVELAQMLVPLSEEKVLDNLEHSMNFSLRMQKLLQFFRLPTKPAERNLVELIRTTARESENAHRNLRIEVSWTADAIREKTRVGRLMPMVWMNIFRNASQHAGEHPTVNVNISLVDQQYNIIITDDGPGIPEEKKQYLFEKGGNLEQQDKGVGLHLSKLIIE